jgi:alanyl-tRNA synthetase
VDAARRRAIERHHTVTHLLHWALHEVASKEASQKGSNVTPEKLTFDFNSAALTPAQVADIEKLVNERILENAGVSWTEVPHAEVKTRKDVMQFFGDKYGDVVRVLEAGPHSTELCGGTHVSALGEIGPVKITSEGSIGSNIRRIEAVSGVGPIERLRAGEDRIGRAAALLGVPVDDLLDGIEKRLGELKGLRDEVKGLRRQLNGGLADELVGAAVDGVIVARVDADDRDDVRDLALTLRDRDGIRAVVLGAAPEGKGVALVAAVDTASGLDAGALIAEAARMVGGGGGKGADLAVAGGRAPEHLDAALDQVRSQVGE